MDWEPDARVGVVQISCDGVLWSSVAPLSVRGNDSMNPEMGGLCCETRDWGIGCKRDAG